MRKSVATRSVGFARGVINHRAVSCVMTSSRSKCDLNMSVVMGVVMGEVD